MEHQYTKVFKGLQEALDNSHNIQTCHVEMFRSLFWRPFIGKTTTADKQTAEKAWVERISGGWTIPVDLLDGDGKVVGTVPPLYSTDSIRVDPTSLSSYTFIANKSPIAASGAANTLVETANDTIESSTPDKLLAQWVDLYKLMGESIPQYVPDEVEEDDVEDGDLTWT